MSGLIEAAAVRHALDVGERWEPGKPLKLFLAGYVGSRNTGSDVRVEEMIRQFRHVLSDDQVELTIGTLDPALSAGYFRAVRQVLLPELFPKFLFDECPKHHGVVACEGSMFKSKFTNLLTVFMAGALGMANAESKLSVGYGAEAGEMTPSLQDFSRKQARDSLVLCRNEPSRRVLEGLGIRALGGTDTAWTFEPSSRARGEELLRRGGWDGKQKVLAVCPINPFWWPIRPSLVKALARRLDGQYKEEHNRSIYFHEYSEESARRYNTYLGAFAEAITRFASEQSVFVALVGMERLDRRSCEDLAGRLKLPATLFVSDEHNMYDMVAMLRRASMMVASRYHAIVTSMPALVPSAGVSMDERIRNLLTDRGHTDLLFAVDEEGLSEKLFLTLRRLDREAEAISDGIGRTLPRQLQLMGQMGIDFADEVARVYPDFPRRKLQRTWESHLPPLSRPLADLLERFA